MGGRREGADGIKQEAGVAASFFSLSSGGEDRNRTRSSPTTSLNTLIYKGILTLILKGFKRFLTLHADYPT